MRSSNTYLNRFLLGTVAFSIVLCVQYSAFAQSTTNPETRTPKPGNLKVKTLLTSETPLVSAAIAGDLLLVVGENEVAWYRLTPQAKLISSFEVGPHRRLLRGDLYDLNKDGSPEALLTAMQGDRLSSLILGLRTKSASIIKDNISWYFRIAEQDGAPVMLGQRRGSFTPFSGAVYRLRWEGDELRRGAKVNLPRKANLYSFNWLPAGQILAVRPSGRSEVWEQRSAKKWKRRTKLSGKWKGISAQSIPRSRDFHGGNIAVPLQLPLVGWQRRGEFIVATQKPVLGQTVGRVPYWREWKLAGLSSDLDQFASSSASWNYESDGALYELRPLDGGERFLAVVQSGRDSPWDGAPRQSYVLLFELKR